MVEPGQVQLDSDGPVSTRRIAAALVPFLVGGDVVLLQGELGAGKTAFTQGLATAAGVDEVVTSPTFVLLRPYRTAIGPDLLHADIYRLGQLREVIELGLSELLEEGAFAVIEWGERAAPALGPEALAVRIDYGERDTDRRVTISPTGPSWDARWPSLSGALQASTRRAA